MKKIVVMLFVLSFIVVGCAGMWLSPPIESFKPSETVPPSLVCQTCHQDQFDSWKKTRHADGKYMAKIPVTELHECGVCHIDLSAHVADL